MTKAQAISDLNIILDMQKHDGLYCAGIQRALEYIRAIEPTCCKDCSKFDDCRISQGAEFWCKYAEENG